MIIKKMIIKNRKGVTLTELLVSLAILMVVIGPFLGSLLSTTQSNADSETQLVANSLAQKAMEEIKARPSFIKGNVGNASSTYLFTDLNPSYINNTPRYTVEYKIVSKDTGTLVSPLVISGLNYDIGVLTPHISIDSSDFTLAEKMYNLDITGAAASYTYSFYDASVGTGTPVNFSITGSDIVIKVQMDSRSETEAKFNIQTNLNIDDSSIKVKMYIIDDTNPSGIQVINTGSKELLQINEVSSPVSYSNTLYEVTVTVKKDNKVVNTLVSYVKK